MADRTIDATIARLDDATTRIVAALAALRRAHPHVAIANQTGALSDSEVGTVVADLQIQVSRDFALHWGIDAALSFVPRGGTPPADAWWLVLLDTADQAGALGYHETTAAGQPMGKVFVVTAQQDGAAWSGVLSHEALELLADPYACCTTFIQTTNTAGTIYAYEVCDPCEGATYTIGTTVVSDFVTPAWFTPGAPGSYDHLGHIAAPLALDTGGYVSTYAVPNTEGWTQTFNNGMTKPLTGADDRRFLPRDQWQRSTEPVEGE